MRQFRLSKYQIAKCEYRLTNAVITDMVREANKDDTRWAVHFDEASSSIIASCKNKPLGKILGLDWEEIGGNHVQENHKPS